MATIQDIFDWLNQGAQGDIPGTGGEQPNAPAASASSQPPQQSPQAVMTTTLPSQGISNLDYNDLWNQLSHYHAIATTPPGEDIQFDKQGMHVTGSDPDPWTPPPTMPRGDAVSPDAYKGTSQPSPQDYAGDIPPSLMGQYQSLINNGIPPSVARYMLTEPSYAEGQRPHSTPRYTPPQQYLGGQVDPKTGRAVDPISPYTDQTPDYEAILEGRSNEQFTSKQNNPVYEGEVQGMQNDTQGLFRLPTGEWVPPVMTPQPGSKSALDYYRSLGDPSSFWWNPQPNTFWGNNLLYGQSAQGGANQGWQ